MSDEEKDFLRQEEAFPMLSGMAFDHARDAAQRAGKSLLLSKGGTIYRVLPDGERQWVKDIEPPVRMPHGFKATIP